MGHIGTRIDIEKALDLARQGYGLHRIARILGCHKSTVEYQIKGVVHRDWTALEDDNLAACRDAVRTEIREASRDIRAHKDALNQKRLVQEERRRCLAAIDAEIARRGDGEMTA